MQMQASDNGGAALCMMLESLGRYVPLREMREHCMCSRNGSDLSQVCRAAEDYGVKAEVRQATAEEIGARLPRMVTWRRGTYVIVDKVKKNIVTLRDPAKGMYSVTWEKFRKNYGGKVFELTPGANFQRGGKRPGFIPTLRARLKPYSKAIAALSALSCAAVLVGLWAVKLRKTMLDDVMSGVTPDAFLRTALLMVAAWAITTLIGFIQTCREQELNHTMAAKNAAALYKKLFHMPAAFYEGIGRWEIMDRLEKSNTLGEDMVDLIVSRAFGALSMLLYIALMFVYSPMISAMLIIGQIIFVAATLAVQYRLVMRNRSSVSLNERVRSSMMNGLDRIDTIKATGSEGGFFRIWSDMMRDSEGNSNGMLSLEAMLTLLQTGCSLCSSGLMLFLGAYLIRRGYFTLGALSALQSVFGSASAKF
ncbi:MAG: hypothetical protein HUJ65_08195, partial [Oscillospiraceae bacterium]|nr:hypothetical protein [Oscillospiraceae bacterium]